MTPVSPFALSPRYIVGQYYDDLQEMSALDVYLRMGGYEPKVFTATFLSRQYNERDAELLLDLTGNLDAPLTLKIKTLFSDPELGARSFAAKRTHVLFWHRNASGCTSQLDSPRDRLAARGIKNDDPDYAETAF
ncbi:MAG: hypothetical protein IPK63_18990 [Candidatus Competibacteraceae bacterium]|nr:hypothetical protein [Candidatus Competibacteraceae bacterium]